MKIIQCLADIEAMKALGEVPIALLKEIEQHFLEIYQMENSEQEVLQFRLHMREALFVVEKKEDDVLAKLGQSLELEYVERVELAEIAYYRCAIRNDHEFQMYYTLVGTHDQEVEEWLLEQSQEGW